ncbi:MAG TPA: hypothetical protein VF186_09000 [Gaiellaceae bacterium]|jgi:hypothetical protein
MASAGIPEPVQRLIGRCIRSVEQLELLLLLRHDSARSWSPEEAARQLYTAPQSAELRLGELVRARLVERDGDRYRYAADAATDTVVGDLERVYRTHRSRIIAMIFDKPPAPVQAFADAFRLRRDD